MNSDNGASDADIAALVHRLMEAAGVDPSSVSPSHAISFRVIITGAGGAPAAPGGSAIPPAHDPEPEICRIGDELCITAGLPGVEPDHIAVCLEGQALSIGGKNTIRDYHYAVPLPPVDKETLSVSQKNGVVECRVKVLPEVPAEPKPE